MILYKTFQGDEVVAAADLALKSRLFVSGWDLSYSLRDIRKNPHPRDTIIIALDDQVLNQNGILSRQQLPIGIAIFDGRDKMLEAFVRKSYRLRGIGRKMIKKLFSDGKIKGYRTDTGTKGSHQFWLKVTDDSP